MVDDSTEPRLFVRGLSGPILGRAWTVRADRPLLLGRNVASAPDMLAVSIPDPRISSRHCQIQYESGTFRLVDLNSRNGVLINGKRVPPGASEELRDGDLLSLAEVALEVRLSQGGEAYLSESKLSGGPRTVADVPTGRGSSPVVIELMPSPLAVGIRKVRHAIEGLDTVQETLRSFEVILRFHTLVALSEYLARDAQDAQVAQLLSAFYQRPFTLGRWLELHNALVRTLAGDDRLVIEELARGDEVEDVKRWKSNAAHIVELRNSLLHKDGIHAASAEALAPEMSARFAEIAAGAAFWMGYRFIAVESGSWNDVEGVFRYPCRMLIGCSAPFELRLLKSACPLPPRVPIVISRDGKRRLSLGPLQAILAGEDKQMHWFWLGECSAGRTTLLTYPASFRIVCPVDSSLQKLLSGEGMPSKARAEFSGELPDTWVT